MVHLDVAKVLEQFDALIADGELFYTPTEPIRLSDDDVRFTFRVVSSYKSKPQLSPADSSSSHVSSATASYATSIHRPPPSDGSDIDHSDPAFLVAFFNRTCTSKPIHSLPSPAPGDSSPPDQGVASQKQHTHKLILNKFCAFRPQYILLTTDPLQRQHFPLDSADFHAAWQVLTSLTTRHYVIFNGGKEGGSSRVHKHMQVLEEPDELSKNIMPELLLPYKCFRYTIPQDLSQNREESKAERTNGGGANMLFEAYKEHFKETVKLLRLKHGEQIPHNVILTRDWMLTVPRRSATVEGIEAHIVNAAGMVGQVWLNNEAQLEGWKRVGPRRVLAGLGVPLDGEQNGLKRYTADQAVAMRKY